MIRTQTWSRFLQVVLLFTVTGCLSLGEKARWQALSDGKTLAGWKQLGGKARYQVEDGTIVGTSVLGKPNSFL